MDLAGAPLLQRLYERISSSRLSDRIVVATSNCSENDAVEALCLKIGCAVSRGSETDVLGRMICAAGDAEVMVRLTADNPFVDGFLIDYVLERFLKARPHIRYASNIVGSGFPYGLFVEVTDMAALVVAAESKDLMDREHVTWYIRQRPTDFPALTIKAPLELPQQPLSIDTKQDYLRLKAVFESMYQRKTDFSLADIARYQ
jgi:spore coat polysaccharide biosynthesis protein SpsF (cytidylyltransferase family)